MQVNNVIQVSFTKAKFLLNPCLGHLHSTFSVEERVLTVAVIEFQEECSDTSYTASFLQM